MAMRSDAWLQMMYVEMVEYQRVCDELATANALLEESRCDHLNLVVSDNGDRVCDNCGETFKRMGNGVLR